MDLTNLSPDDILRMDYNQIISVVQETNRPPGGIRSIIEVAQYSFLGPQKKVLEIGTSTGITAIELADLTGAHIVAVDINSHSLEIAKTRAKERGVDGRIEFLLQDATHLQFPSESFDLVFCGNVTSIVNDKNKVLSEYVRTLKYGGILAAIPMYYISCPSNDLIDKVSKAIQVDITPLYKNDWVSFFNTTGLASFWIQDYGFDNLSNDQIDGFVSSILQRSHLKDLKPKTAETLHNVYSNFMRLFRDNLSQMGYSIILLRKEFPTIDAELFTAHRLNNC